jgi:UDP-2-acetamido-3-amino-2,3-dideoxy-glucuronate N-acetyltransferase
MNTKIHSSALVETKRIGDQTQIWQYSIVLPGAVIGNNCNVNCHCFIENDVVIGNNVTLKSGVYVWDGIRIEDDVFVGPNVTFSNDMRPRSKRRPEAFGKTVLKKGASIGGGAVLISGITIGEYAFIGAGAVVTKDVPNNTLWYGNPAKCKGYICTCAKSLNNTLKCEECDQQYILINNKLEVTK